MVNSRIDFFDKMTEQHVSVISDEFIADLARGAGSPIGPVADAAHRERERRRRLHDRDRGASS